MDNGIKKFSGIQVVGAESELAQRSKSGNVSGNDVMNVYKKAIHIAQAFDDAEEKIRVLRRSQAEYIIELIRIDAPRKVFKGTRQAAYAYLKEEVRNGSISEDEIIKRFESGASLHRIYREICDKKSLEYLRSDEFYEEVVDCYKEYGEVDISIDGYEKYVKLSDNERQAILDRERVVLRRAGAVGIGGGKYVNPSTHESDEMQKAIDIRLISLERDVLALRDLIESKKGDDTVLMTRSPRLVEFVMGYAVEDRKSLVDAQQRGYVKC